MDDFRKAFLLGLAGGALAWLGATAVIAHRDLNQERYWDARSAALPTTNAVGEIVGEAPAVPAPHRRERTAWSDGPDPAAHRALPASAVGYLVAFTVALAILRRRRV